MPGRARTGDVVGRSVSRRRLLQATIGTTGLLLLTACGGATALPPPAEASKPGTTPAAASPAPAVAAASPGPAASPAASPSPVAVVAAPAQAAPAARPPVNLAGATVSYLGWASFIPTADAFIKNQIEEWARQVGARATVEIVNANDVQPRLAAAIQSGSGPDVVQLRDNWALTFLHGLHDLSDLVDELTRIYGDLYPVFAANLRGSDGRWYALPHDNSGGAMHWRQSWFTNVGATTFPDRLDAYHDLGRRLKARGQPFGQAFGHAFGDPPSWCYGLLWGYGGREIDAQGKVAVNSPETVQAVRDMAQAFKDAYDETALGWDDGANNRAFLTEMISSTLNGSSIWFAARNERVPFFGDIGLALMPAGPRERALLGGTNEYCIPRYSKNVDVAKELLRYLMRPEVYEPRFLENQSYIAGIGPKHDRLLPWEKLPPALRVFRDVGQYARAVGFPGSASPKAGLAWSRYVIVDMFARAIQGESAESAVAWAEGELKAIYE